MRRFTFITIIVLFTLIAGAAVYQIAIASGDREPYPGPNVGTPLPTIAPTP